MKILPKIFFPGIILVSAILLIVVIKLSKPAPPSPPPLPTTCDDISTSSMEYTDSKFSRKWKISCKPRLTASLYVGCSPGIPDQCKNRHETKCISPLINGIADKHKSVCVDPTKKICKTNCLFGNAHVFVATKTNPPFDLTSQLQNEIQNQIVKYNNNKLSGIPSYDCHKFYGQAESMDKDSLGNPYYTIWMYLQKC